MELTPQSTRSPTPPFIYNTNPQPLFEYPSPAQSDSRYNKSTDSLQGLGLYSCPAPGSIENEGTEPNVQSPSTATNSWANTTLQQQRRNTPRSNRSTPNILSSEYDPFAPYNPTVTNSYSQTIYSTQAPEAQTHHPISPLPSSSTSQRSSLSSAPPSEIFTQAGSIHSYTPRIKMEDHPDYPSGGESMMMSSPQQQGHSLLVTSASTYPGSLEATYYHDQSPMGGWQKVEYVPNADLPPFSTLSIPNYDRRIEGGGPSPSRSQDLRQSSGVARIRQPRKLTTKEDANFQCNVKGCGKLFGRSYNYKAHMETHDAAREYPFPCPLENCTKKFVRKTDLQRHHQSVHMKQRNHRCDYCSRFFARKDTLRRYVLSSL